MYPYVLFWNVNWNSIFLATSSCPLYYSAKYITKLQVEGKDIVVLSPESHSYRVKFICEWHNMRSQICFKIIWGVVGGAVDKTRLALAW